VSVLVWVLVGIALWHFTVLLPEPGVPNDNPPGIRQALWPLPGALAALGAAYWIGSRAEDGE
jgi:hypothetical protein